MPRNPIRRNVPPYRPPGIDSRGIARPPVRAPEPEPATAPNGLVLLIAGRAYGLTVLRPDPGTAAALVRLTKADGTVHYVAVTIHGPQCDCGDFTWRHAARGTACKHVRALAALAATLEPLAAFLPDPVLPETWEEFDAVYPPAVA